MSENARETLCTRCGHRQVCKFTEQMQASLKQVDDLNEIVIQHETPFIVDITCSQRKEHQLIQR